MSKPQHRAASVGPAEFFGILRDKDGSALRSAVDVVFDAMAEAVVVVDRHHRTVFANATARRFLGLAPADPLPSDWTAVGGRYLADGKTLTPLDQLPSARALRGEHVADEIMLIRPDRQAEGAWVSATARPVRSQDGSIAGAIVVWQDVTEEKHAEKALRHHEAELRRLAGIVELGHVFIRGLDSRILFWSEGAGRLYGFSKAEAVGQKSHELLRTVFPTPLETIHKQLLTDGAWQGELVHFHRDGSPIDVASHWVLHRDGLGEPDVILEVNNDISAQRRAERALRASERIAREQLAQLEAIYASAPVGLCFVTPDLRPVSLNETLAQMYDGRVERDTGRTVRELVPELADTLEPILRRALETGQPMLNVEVSGETSAAPGLRRHWLASFYPVKADDGSVRGVNVAVLEVTERKRIEDALRELNHTLEQQVAERTAQLAARADELRELAVQLTQAEFRESRRIAALLHDELQQTLVSQRMILERLREQVPADCRPDMGLLYTTATEALDFCRTLTADLSVPALNEPGLAPLLNWLKTRARERHELQLRLILRGADPDFPFSVKMELYFVLRELFLNMVKHAGVKRGTVVLDGSKPGEVELVVRDRGKGFRPGEAPLWDGVGSGIGLASVRERVGRLAGRVEIESRPGRGTSITLRLPRTSATPVVAAPARPKGTGLPAGEPAFWLVGSRQTTVLLADDHRLVRSTLRGLLEAGGEFKVVGEARDGAEAVELGLQLKPDIVLMDVDMPRMNGIEATRRLKSAAPDTVVVGLSMHDQASLVDAMRAAGARDYLSKDTDFRTLCQTLRNALIARSLSDLGRTNS